MDYDLSSGVIFVNWTYNFNSITVTENTVAHQKIHTEIESHIESSRKTCQQKTFSWILPTVWWLQVYADTIVNAEITYWGISNSQS